MANTQVYAAPRMAEMGKYVWKLPEYLESRNLSAYQVAQRVPRGKENTVYRLARVDDKPGSVSFEVMGMIRDALEEVTGEPPTLTDLLEYQEG